MLRPLMLVLMGLLVPTASAEFSQQPFVNVVTFDASAARRGPHRHPHHHPVTEEQGLRCRPSSRRRSTPESSRRWPEPKASLE